MNTNKDLFDTVHTVYGHSSEWLLGLAKVLDVSYNTAQHLAQEAGYYRHRLINNVTLEQFTKQPYATYVIRKKGLVVVDSTHNIHPS